MMRVGLALPDDGERATVFDWLRAVELQPHALAGGAAMADDVRGLCLDCLVVDAALVERGYLGRLSRHDSRLPIVVVADAEHAASASLQRRGFTVVDRPLDAQGVGLAVALAHGEGRQARSGSRKPAARFPAKVGEAVADLLDVSDSGLRLEIDQAHAVKLGPQFRLQVPMVALDVMVRRVWVGRGRGERLQCGALLLSPTPGQRRAWGRVLDLAGGTAAVLTSSEQPAPARAPSRPPARPPARSMSDRVSALFADSPFVGALTSRFLRSTS